MKELIDQTRCSLSHQTLGKFIIFIEINFCTHMIIVLYLDVLFNYPSSVVSLSLLLLQSNVSMTSFISEQMKSFILHKKDASSYIVSSYDFDFDVHVLCLCFVLF